MFETGARFGYGALIALPKGLGVLRTGRAGRRGQFRMLQPPPPPLLLRRRPLPAFPAGPEAAAKSIRLSSSLKANKSNSCGRRGRRERPFPNIPRPGPSQLGPLPALPPFRGHQLAGEGSGFRGRVPSRRGRHSLAR